MAKIYYVLLRKDNGVKEFEKKEDVICILKNPVKHYLQNCSEIYKIFKFLQYYLE